MSVQLRAIPNAFYPPRPNWDVIRAWIERHVPESDRSGGWTDVAMQWLDTLNEALGGAYRIDAANDLLLFAPCGSTQADSLLRYAESALGQIVNLLGDVAGEDWDGPLVVMLFADEETYYTYLSQFYPNGEFGASAGTCLREGQISIVLKPSTMDGLQLCTVHEMTHACLGHLNLPLWLEEGITQYAEQALHTWGRFILDPSDAAQMRRHWQEHGLGRFWWGQGFFAPDPEQAYSYRLAAILFNLVVVDHGSGMPEFVRHAKADDAGENAAREFLGTSLAELATRFLGDGEWEPVPPDGPTYCRRGAWYLSRGQYGKAIDDLDRALQLDSGSAESLAYRGLARSYLGQNAAAIADYEAAILLDPKNSEAHNGLAWLLATCPDEEYRDGQRALEHAEKACELTASSSWYCLCTLAAAHAEAGDFEQARALAKESLRLCPQDERAGCEERLRLYKKDKPYREHPSLSADECHEQASIRPLSRHQ